NTLPVTAKGQAQVDKFNPDDNPEWNCEPQTMPEVLDYPYPFELTRPDANTIVLHYEVNELVRTVHLTMASHPANTPRTPPGHLIGRFENGDLVIETACFSRVRWGSGRGGYSGEQKSTVERYTLAPDGKSVALKFTMTDPEYLSAPVSEEQKYN